MTLKDLLQYVDAQRLESSEETIPLSMALTSQVHITDKADFQYDSLVHSVTRIEVKDGALRLISDIEIGQDV